MSNPAQPVIEVRNVRRVFRSSKKGEGLKGTLNLLFKPQYQTHEALKGVSFTVEPGAFIGLVGANGAGKTTLLKILAGLIPASSGEARVLGYNPFKRPLDFRQQISLVMGQKAQLWWDLPALDAFDLLRAIYEIPPHLYKERLDTLTELLDVKRHLSTQIRRLSLGERMKMELIGAILHWPKVIFLDEPTIGLDVLAAHKLREFLKVFNQREKATIILTSHNMEDIERLCTRMILLRSGEVIFDGAPGKLTREGERRLRIRLMENPTIPELALATGISPQAIQHASADPSDASGNEGGGEDAEKAPTSGLSSGATEESRIFHFNIRKEEIVPVLQKLMNHYQVVDMGVEEQSLEMVIQRLYEGSDA